MYTISIKNGHVIDFSNNTDQIRDLYIKGGKFVNQNPTDDTEGSEKLIDATDCYVLPGLIDAHLHAFEGGSGDLGASVDSICLPNGVTTAIDGGSSGPFNFSSFYRTAIVNSRTTIKALLSPSPYGVMLPPYEEVSDPRIFDQDMIVSLFEQYGAHLVGLKIRQHVDVCSGYGNKPLMRAKEIGSFLTEKGYRGGVTVHFSELEQGLEVENILSPLEKNDVFCHMYQTIGKTIIGKDGKVLSCVKDARERGVLFDSSIGRIHFSLKNIWSALDDGFYPDIISTDIIKKTAYRLPAVSILNSMSMFLNLGMPLMEIFKAVTDTPAKTFDLSQEAGTLQIGKPADVAILKLWDKETKYEDVYGNSFFGSKIFVPMATVKRGYMAFEQIFFR